MGFWSSLGSGISSALGGNMAIDTTIPQIGAYGSPPSGGWYVSGDGTSTYGTVSSTWPQLALVIPDEWDAKDSQEAASHGWLLVGDSTFPSLVAWQSGTKAHMGVDEIFTDVLEQAMAGQCPIAYKILCVLTRNRSPRAEYAKAVEELAKDYGMDN